MDTKNQLMHQKSSVLKQIAEAAQRGNSQEVLEAGERLKKIDSLIDRYEKLLRDVSDLGREEPEPHYLQKTQAISRSVSSRDLGTLDEASGREVGKTVRMDFIKKASEEGIHLEHIKGSVYETKSGNKVGIAVATERKPDHWFLGLPSKGFDHSVLLCKRDTGDIVEIFVPKNFFTEYGRKMSQRDGQMKFNVARRGNGYVILVPGTNGINVSKFLGDYSLLR
jgi:hypothetical protein